MAELIKNAISSRISDLGKELWKAATMPYNAAVIMATVAVLFQGQAWKLRIE
jgi:hypothetical protein